MQKDSLFQQFVISNGDIINYSNWRKQYFAGVWINTAPNIPFVAIHDSNDNHIGYIIGWAIINGEIFDDGDKLQLTCLEETDLSWMDDACGRFVILLWHHKSVWFFVDAAASLAAVVSPRHHTIASTTNLLPTTYGCDEDSELISLIDVRNTDRFFPFGLTNRKNISRILPNHAVNLFDYSVHRIWPSEKITPYGENENDAINNCINKICRALQCNIKPIVGKKNVYIQLSGGQDTRIVLAATKNYIDCAKFYTIRTNEKNLQLDCLLASEMARRFHLRHEIIDFVDPETQDLERWLAQSGECVAGRVWQMATTVKKLVAHDYWISGQFGEVGRGFYWRQSDMSQSTITVAELLKRASVPTSKQITEAATKWLECIPAGPLPWILDMMYIEHRIGCGMGPAYYGGLLPRVNISPFNQRNIFSSMLQLPVMYRFNQQMYRDLVQHMWPDLLEIPINRGFGLNRIKYWEMEVKTLKKYMPDNILHLAKFAFHKLNRHI